MLMTKWKLKLQMLAWLKERCIEIRNTYPPNPFIQKPSSLTTFPNPWLSHPCTTYHILFHDDKLKLGLEIESGAYIICQVVSNPGVITCRSPGEETVSCFWVRVEYLYFFSVVSSKFWRENIFYSWRNQKILFYLDDRVKCLQGKPTVCKKLMRGEYVTWIIYYTTTLRMYMCVSV